MKKLGALMLLWAVAAVWPAAPSRGQDDAALDELLNIPTQRPQPRVEEDGAGDGLQPRVRRLAEEGAAADVLDAALRQMQDVAARLLDRLDAGLDTQREQESILRKLDQVIAAAQQQEEDSSSSGGGGGADGGARRQDVGGESVARQQQSGGGQAGAPESAQAHTGDNRGEMGAGGRPPGDARDAPLEEVRREWGNLPPRLRNELTEGLSETFSPAYRELTEQYYRALAEED